MNDAVIAPDRQRVVSENFLDDDPRYSTSVPVYFIPRPSMRNGKSISG